MHMLHVTCHVYNMYMYMLHVHVVVVDVAACLPVLCVWLSINHNPQGLGSSDAIGRRGIAPTLQNNNAGWRIVMTNRLAMQCAALPSLPLKS